MNNNNPIKKLKALIDQCPPMDDPTKKNLLDQLEALDSQFQELLKENHSQAQQLSELTHTHAHHRLDDTRSSNASSFSTQLQKLEISHPTIVSSLDLFFRTLSRLGI